MQCVLTEKHSNQITTLWRNKERVHDSQKVRAKENLKFGHSGPIQIQAAGINQRIKALCQGRH